MMIAFYKLEKPKPDPVVAAQYDTRIAAVCAWLVRYGYTMHVTLAGLVTLRKKEP